MKNIKTTLRIFKKLGLGILLFLLIYVGSAFLISKITVNSDAENQAKGIAIYIQTNGVHTDIVLPIKNEVKDWSQDIKATNTKANDTTATCITFGWGDKGFYLDTPE